MRRLLGMTLGFALMAGPVWAQPPASKSTEEASSPAASAKEPPIVAATRKKLATKVSVEFKETPLQEAVDSLKSQVENLSFWIDTATGVSRNQAMNYKADDKPLAEVLDGMLTKADLHYDIGTPADIRYAGWVIIRKGKAGTTTASATAPSPETKPAPEVKPTPKPPAETPVEDSPEKAEKEAATKLNFAKQLLDDGKMDKARQRLGDIVQKFPTTKAAAEAKELLEKLNQ